MSAKECHCFLMVINTINQIHRRCRTEKLLSHSNKKKFRNYHQFLVTLKEKDSDTQLYKR